MRPTVLLPGDVLCYKKHDLLGNLLAWGEWVDGHENTAYVHVAMVFDSSRLIRQNPGGPAFENLDAQPWDFIDVYRLNVPTPEPWNECLEGAREKHWVEGYAYRSFVNLEFSDLEARLGAIDDAVARRKAANWAMAAITSDCSVFILQEILPDALGVNLLPKLGPGQARPSDVPTCQILTLVAS